MKFCAYCGAKLEDNAKFCLSCGEKCIEFLDENEEPSLEEQKLEEEKKAQEEAERLEQERLEQERLEQERLEQERLEQERLEKERLEAERLEQERLAREEEERKEQERLAELQKKEEENKKLSELENEVAALKAQLAAQQEQKPEPVQEPIKESTVLEKQPSEVRKAEENKKDNFILPIIALAVSLISSIVYLLIKDITNLSIINLGESVVVTLFTLISAIVLLSNRKMNKSTKWLCVINIICCIGLLAFLLITWAGTFPGGGK